MGNQFLKRNKYDLIITLSNLMDSNGLLNKESQKRCHLAVKIYNSNPKSYIVTSGWDYRKDTKLTLADAFKNYLIQVYKINAEKIICEKNSKDTVGDALFSRINIASKYKSNRIAVITSFYHYKRAKEIFNFIYGNSSNLSVISIDDKVSVFNYRKELNSLQRFRNTFRGIKSGEISNIYKRLIKSHPYYNH